MTDKKRISETAALRLAEQIAARPMPSGWPRPRIVSNDIRPGFVYERVQHITLKSIANNPDIKDGMSRNEIDAAINHSISRFVTWSIGRTIRSVALPALSQFI